MKTQKKKRIPHYALWEAWKEHGDAEAEEKLIKLYLPLVDYLANRLAVALPQNVEKEDLISLGRLGLIDALRKFDYKRGLQFETYGMWRIKGAIIDGLRGNDWAPRSLREKGKKIEEAFEELEQKLLRPATEREVSEYLQMPEHEIQKVMSELSLATLLSLDEPLKEEGEEKQPRLGTIVDERNASPERYVEEGEKKRILARAIDQLPEKERTVISLFYYEELTLTEIAQVLELSPSRISQLHAKAIFRLRSVLARQKPFLLQ
ncbi:RNA polymerase sigma-28 factor SigD [Bacillaceae bacterium]